MAFLSIRTLTPTQIRPDSETALVALQSEINLRVDSTNYRHKAQHTEVWEYRNDRWQAVWGQMTAVGGFPPPGE